MSTRTYAAICFYAPKRIKGLKASHFVIISTYLPWDRNLERVNHR